MANVSNVKSKFFGAVDALDADGISTAATIGSATTLTVATHAGRIITCNDANGKFTLPTITSGSVGAGAGANDPNVQSNLGCTYLFWVQTAATDMDIKTDGTDKFYGAIFNGVDSAATGECFAADGADNDVFTQNGGTKGGKIGSWVEFTAIASAKYFVRGSLIGSGTIATPFADA